jgi:SAM-dependent methyltransferase
MPQPINKKSAWSRLLNVVFLPLRLFLSHESLNRLGLQSLRDERCDMVLRFCRGRLLDIGCGNNQLVKKYGCGSVGVDVHDFGAGALIIEDTRQLPFPDRSFQTVSLVASLGHIPKPIRRDVLKEVWRILSKDGVVLITEIAPWLGVIRHKLAWWDRDQTERGIKAEEDLGLTSRAVIDQVEATGFVFSERKRFVLGLNNLYLFKKPA